MNHSTKLVLCFGIVLLVMAAVFVATASASSEVEPAKLFSPPVFALQGPPITYTLTVSINPVGGGSVNKYPDLPVYISGTSVSLTASANPGYTFSNWTGDATGSTNPTTVIMNRAKSVTANFSQLSCFTLTTSASPSGGGSVNANPAPNCGTQYISGTSVSLTASANPSYTFSNWTGDATGSTNPTTVIMNRAKSVTANFVAAPTCYTLTTAVNPRGAGSVNVNTAPNCSGGRYTSGTSVNLTASAGSGYTFSSWTGCDLASGATCTMTMNANKSVTANFTSPSSCYTLTTSVSPSGAGTVVFDPPNCGSQYNPGAVVRLGAVAASGYTFSFWSGDASGSANPTAVTMNGPKSVTANFVGVQPTETAVPGATATSSPLATITPFISGGVATATTAPTPGAALPPTGDSPLLWIASGLVLVMIVIGARSLRQSSA